MNSDSLSAMALELHRLLMERNLTGAMRCCETIEAEIGLFSIAQSLRKVTSGEAYLQITQSAILVADARINKSAIDVLSVAVESCAQQLVRELGVPNSVVVLELSSHQRFPLTIRQVYGLSHVVIPTGLLSDGLDELLLHELGHVHRRSGNRFLDEGWACFAQRIVGDAKKFPFDVDWLHGMDGRCQAALPPLRPFLGSEFARDVFFEDTGLSIDERRLLYLLALSTVDTLVQWRGRSEVGQLLQRLASTASERLCEALVEWSGKPLDAIEREARARLGMVDVPVTCDRAFEIIALGHIARERRDVRLISAFLHESWSGVVAGSEPVVAAAYCGFAADRALIQHSSSLPIDLVNLSNAQRIATEYAGELEHSSQFYFAIGRLATAVAAIAGKASQRNIAAACARQRLARALALNPDDAMVILYRLRLELSTPCEYRESPTKMREWLDRLRELGQFDNERLQIERAIQ